MIKACRKEGEPVSDQVWEGAEGLEFEQMPSPAPYHTFDTPPSSEVIHKCRACQSTTEQQDGDQTGRHRCSVCSDSGLPLCRCTMCFVILQGINGKTSDTAAVYEAVEVDESRLVTVEFITRTNKGMPWQFEAEKRKMRVHPGEMSPG